MHFVITFNKVLRKYVTRDEQVKYDTQWMLREDDCWNLKQLCCLWKLSDFETQREECEQDWNSNWRRCE